MVAGGRHPESWSNPSLSGDSYGHTIRPEQFQYFGLARGLQEKVIAALSPCRPGRWKKSRPKDHQGCVREVVRSSLSSSSGRQNKGVGMWLWDRCSHSSRPIIPPQGVVPARWERRAL